jgi:prevent-host-death family protein
MVEAHVRKVGVVEARQRLRALLDEVAAGKQVCVLRRGKEVARLVPPKGRRQRLPSLRAFRQSLRVRGEALSATVVRTRADARY